MIEENNEGYTAVEFEDSKDSYEDGKLKTRHTFNTFTNNTITFNKIGTKKQCISFIRNSKAVKKTPYKDRLKQFQAKIGVSESCIIDAINQFKILQFFKTDKRIINTGNIFDQTYCNSFYYFSRFTKTNKKEYTFA